MKCLCCKSEKMKPITKPYFSVVDDNYFIIENVPCLLCEDCGEVLYSASVLERIEGMIDRISAMVSKVCIVDYNQAA